MFRRTVTSNAVRRSSTRFAAGGTDPAGARGSEKASTSSASFIPKPLIPAVIGLASVIGFVNVMCYTKDGKNMNEFGSRHVTMPAGKLRGFKQEEHSDTHTYANMPAGEPLPAPSGAGTKSKEYGNAETRRQANPFETGLTGFSKTDELRNVEEPESWYAKKGDLTRADNLSLDGGARGSRDGQAMTDRAKRIQESGARETGKVHF